ncbi:MAG TPA: hypothetical protein VF981_11645, partial [Gemmatimonadaceae bacterium]
AGLTDNTRVSRRQAVWVMAGAVFVVSLVPMVNLDIFVRWDLTFGSGMQTFGALCAALTAGWAMRRGALMAQLTTAGDARWLRAVPFWLRYVVPSAIIGVGAWWLFTDVLRLARGV